MQGKHRALKDLQTTLDAESLALKCFAGSKPLGLETSSPNSTMPLSHVALHINLYSLSRSYSEKASMYQVADGRINPKVCLYLTLVSSKLPCCHQREVVCSKSI